MKYKYKVTPCKSNPPIKCIKNEYGMKDHCVCKECWTKWFKNHTTNYFKRNKTT